jgi:hypothetical protein
VSRQTQGEARTRAAVAAFHQEQVRLLALTATTPPHLLDRELVAEWQRITCRAVGLLAGRPTLRPAEGDR